MVILREKKEPDLHQALIVLRLSYTSSRQLCAGGTPVDFSGFNECITYISGISPGELPRVINTGAVVKTAL